MAIFWGAFFGAKKGGVKSIFHSKKYKSYLFFSKKWPFFQRKCFNISQNVITLSRKSRNFTV